MREMRKLLCLVVLCFLLVGGQTNSKQAAYCAAEACMLQAVTRLSWDPLADETMEVDLSGAKGTVDLASMNRAKDGTITLSATGSSERQTVSVEAMFHLGWRASPMAIRSHEVPESTLELPSPELGQSEPLPSDDFSLDLSEFIGKPGIEILSWSRDGSPRADAWLSEMSRLLKAIDYTLSDPASPVPPELGVVLVGNGNQWQAESETILLSYKIRTAELPSNYDRILNRVKRLPPAKHTPEDRSITFSRDTRYQGTLDVDTLESEGILLVEGDLIVRKSIQARGSIVATGSISIDGEGLVERSDGFPYAMVCENEFRLSGVRIVGDLFCCGVLSAERVTMEGFFICEERVPWTIKTLAIVSLIQ
jgi:hypothetical protein